MFNAKLHSKMSINLADWVRNKKSSQEVSLVVSGVALSDVADTASILGRLGDLGVSAGETIQYFGRAPLGEPIYICVRETVIALRLSEAALISVSDEV